MKNDFDKLLSHHSSVTDGSSVLVEASFRALCAEHRVSSETLAHAFAREVAERFAAGTIDFETGDFAINDLFWASECALTGFSLDVLHAFEDGEVMDPRYPPGTVPWKDYTLPRARGLLARDDESRGADN